MAEHAVVGTGSCGPDVAVGAFGFAPRGGHCIYGTSGYEAGFISIVVKANPVTAAETFVSKHAEW
jgi:4-hydroxyphenylpyruvate dioxygenase-like putative hemolysin